MALRTFVAFIWLALLAGCLGNQTEFGAGSRKMYADQITVKEILPPNAPSISQNFRLLGPSAQRDHSQYEHLGIDITARKGTPVLAAAAGRVTASGKGPLYGNVVVIDHGRDRFGRRLETIYKHLDNRIVSVGQKVKRGQELGGLGKTGLQSSGILHVHFEVLRQDKTGRMVQMDPGLFWAEGRGRVTCFDPEKDWPERPFKAIYPVQCKSG